MKTSNSNFSTERFTVNQIKKSPKLQEKIINYLTNVHNRSKDDPKYKIPLACKLQKDLKLSSYATMCIINKGLKEKLFVKSNISPQCIRFSPDRAVPNPKMLSMLLSESGREKKVVKALTHVEVDVPTGFEKELPEPPKKTEQEAIEAFKESEDTKLMKSFGYEIIAKKLVEFTV